jgi:hypothetical protein
MNPFDAVVDQCFYMLDDLRREGYTGDLAVAVVKAFYHTDVIDAALIKLNK